MNTADAKRVVETALICAQQPLQLREIGLLFDEAVASDSLKVILSDLQDEWSVRGVELVHVATGWRFQSRPDMRQYLDKLHPEKPPRYSRAVVETLAIVAYRQPATRGDMEDIRGVTINSMILKQLEDRGWVEVIGHRETVGRPALYATTKQFLDDLGIDSLNQLPVMAGNAAQLSAIEALSGPAQIDIEADPVKFAQQSAAVFSLKSAEADGFAILEETRALSDDAPLDAAGQDFSKRVEGDE
jgi:segregation and condensation protein B